MEEDTMPIAIVADTTIPVALVNTASEEKAASLMGKHLNGMGRNVSGGMEMSHTYDTKVYGYHGKLFFQQ